MTAHGNGNGGDRRARIRSIFRAGAWLVVGGLVVQLVTLYWSHPIAFLAFLGLGVPLVAAGAAAYLWALLHLTS